MGYPVQRLKTPVTILDEGTTAYADTAYLSGYIVGVMCDVPALDGTTTLTIAITDQDGFTVYSKATIAEGAKFTEFVDANNMLRRIPVAGVLRITCTATNAQTGGDKVIPVVLLLDR